jgi:Zn ribbon nucleic-acid-binding protein
MYILPFLYLAECPHCDEEHQTFLWRYRKVGKRGFISLYISFQEEKKEL